MSTVVHSLPGTVSKFRVFQLMSYNQFYQHLVSFSVPAFFFFLDCSLDHKIYWKLSRVNNYNLKILFEVAGC